MKVQINTDGNIDGDEALDLEVEALVRDAIDRFSDDLTRVEVHLSDENSSKKGGNADIRCLVEARLRGIDPVVVTHSAASVDEAVEGASRKMRDRLDTVLGKLGRR
ncbi:MAG TPA: HPF/RaiA family ribosome-associated protein [Longimicrobiaceae bacterium]|nr:HPF/RaiA family ribosome-associated protein [Longimicrobiaceae bacterium]